MTFDETWEKIKEESYPFEIPGEAGDAEVLESDLIDIFEELRETYAPTVELTQEQYGQLQTAKALTNLMSLCYELINSKNSLYNSLYYLNSEKLATAWLHPETIKVVEK